MDWDYLMLQRWFIRQVARDIELCLQGKSSPTQKWGMSEHQP